MSCPALCSLSKLSAYHQIYNFSSYIIFFTDDHLTLGCPAIISSPCLQSQILNVCITPHIVHLEEGFVLSISAISPKFVVWCRLERSIRVYGQCFADSHVPSVSTGVKLLCLKKLLLLKRESDRENRLTPIDASQKEIGFLYCFSIIQLANYAR